MPDYKKKKSHKGSLKNKITDNTNNIKMHRIRSSIKEQDEMVPKVIRGKKLQTKFKIRVLFCIVSILLICFIVAHFLFPVGIFETLNNFISSAGSGKYPITVGEGTSIDVVSRDNYYYLLNQTNLVSISNSGKIISDRFHGYSNPCIKTSNTRAIIFDQGNESYSISTVKKELKSNTESSKIITANISDSGYYVIASYSDEYASKFTVYNKKFNAVFTWNCAKELINSVCISPNGKKIAVSTMNGNNGEISTKLYLFNINNTDPTNTFDYENESIYSVEANSKGVYVLSSKGYDFIRWSNGNKSENKSDYQVSGFRISDSGAIVILNRESDLRDNTIKYLSKKGESLFEFKFYGNINDIKLKNSHVYLLGDSNAYIYDVKGNLISSCECGYGAKFLAVTGTHSIDTVLDNSIQSFEIK